MANEKKKIQVKTVEGSDYAIPVISVEDITGISSYAKATDVETSIDGLRTSITNEQQRAQKEEQDIKSNLDAEIERAKTAEATIITNSDIIKNKLDISEFNTYKTEHQSEYSALNEKVTTFLGTNTDTLTGIKNLIQAAEESDEIASLTTMVGEKLESKANSENVYTKTEVYNQSEVDTKLKSKANSEDVYKKDDLDDTTKFYIDNSEHATGTVTLVAGSTYTLSGYLPGHIVIDGSNITSAGESTTIILNDLILISDVCKAIEYTGTSKSLKIKIKDGSQNFITLKSDALMESTDENYSTGAIYSQNNIQISGTGYLTINNEYGNHAIKAEGDINIVGRPHISIDNNKGHDGIHGSSVVRIYNGEFEIKNVNDGIGTGEASTDAGKEDHGTIILYGGKFNISNCKEDQVDGKKASVYVESPFFSWEGEVPSKLTKYTFDNGSVSSSADSITYTDLALTDSVYNIPAANQYCKVSGTITNKIQSNAKVNLTLSDAFINVSGDSAIYHSVDASRVQIKVEEGKVAYVTADAITLSSVKNIEIGGDGVLYIISTGDSTNAVDGSTVTIKGDGNKYFYSKDGYSIQGTEIVIGEETDTDITTSPETGTSDESIYTIGGVHARLSSKGKKGTISLLKQQAGDVVLDNNWTYEEAAVENNGIVGDGDFSLVSIIDSIGYGNYDETSLNVTILDKISRCVLTTTFNENTKALEDTISEKEKEIQLLSAENLSLRQKINNLDDRLAFSLYPEYPTISYTKDENVESVKVLRGNADDAEEVWCLVNSTKAINKDGSGYSAAGDNAQFNAIVTVKDGYTLSVTEPETKNYNKCTNTLVEGSTVSYKVKLTKISGDVDLQFVTTAKTE